MGDPGNEFERQLLRRSMGALTAERPCCVECRRTPLLGERVHVYDAERVVCALCRPRCADAPIRSELVRGSAHGHGVRPTPRVRDGLSVRAA